MKQIKPCPFCGNDGLFVSERNTKSYVRCGKCYAYGPDGKDKAEAIERWNAAPRKMKHICKNCYYMDVDFASCFCWLHDIDVYLTMTCDKWRDKDDVGT